MQVSVPVTTLPSLTLPLCFCFATSARSESLKSFHTTLSLVTQVLYCFFIIIIIIIIVIIIIIIITTLLTYFTYLRCY